MAFSRRKDARISTHAPAQGATLSGLLADGGPPVFQPTLPHRERRIFLQNLLFRSLDFNPRSRTGSDCKGCDVVNFILHFNPRSRTGSDSNRPPGDTQTRINFNPRSRTGSDRLHPLAHLHQGHFNPRSRTGSDLGIFLPIFFITPISTHAPAQGATLPLIPYTIPMLISTHAPAQGATGGCGGFRCYRLISTHAPAQGATAGGLWKYSAELFQPTLPHRERLFTPKMLHRTDYFNPRSRTGSDGEFQQRGIHFLISTHAPAQGATNVKIGFDGYNELNFNPRSRTGSDAGPPAGRCSW